MFTGKRQSGKVLLYTRKFLGYAGELVAYISVAPDQTVTHLFVLYYKLLNSLEYYMNDR